MSSRQSGVMIFSQRPLCSISETRHRIRFMRIRQSERSILGSYAVTPTMSTKRNCHEFLTKLDILKENINSVWYVYGDNNSLDIRANNMQHQNSCNTLMMSKCDGTVYVER